jgi:3'-5' exoribonuclease
MPLQYLRISELKPGTTLARCVLLCGKPNIRNRKDGGQYAEVRLRDGLTTLRAVQWDNLQVYEGNQISEDGFVEVSGEVAEYNGALQLRITRIAPLADSAVDPQWFLPKCPQPLENMVAELDGAIAAIKNPWLSKLLNTMFAPGSFRSAFEAAPAAASIHHAYLGGLLEHTLSVRRNALNMAANYEGVDLDLLSAGALLHDIGKTAEYSYQRKIGRTDAGELLHHIPMGVAAIEVHCSRIPDFPPSLKTHLEHLVVSHHGQLEFSSPSAPRTLEAILLHHADLLDAEAQSLLEARKNAATSGNRWDLVRMFDRRMFLGTGEAAVTFSGSAEVTRLHTEPANSKDA